MALLLELLQSSYARCYEDVGTVLGRPWNLESIGVNRSQLLPGWRNSLILQNKTDRGRLCRLCTGSIGRFEASSRLQKPTEHRAVQAQQAPRTARSYQFSP